ncbi:hypothetical protein V8E54_002859 [Elaphomyces granulatus]
MGTKLLDESFSLPRSGVIFDDWDDLKVESQLLEWNHPSQTEPLKIVGNLPVSFATVLSKIDDRAYDRQPLNDAVRDLSNETWKIGFRLRGTHWDRFQFNCFCCQDVDHERASVAKGRRDGKQVNIEPIT